ncbi:hypothetical protein A3A67_00175 [Candidatus Peribacteria bacterium RIFCSPLOWO2_01_FULL_51_18]|nr:MAG: hypothetical protein A3A67_00175 [Candidatus Peribacteria bacterium RIFCSPLOWO2_01_FULL_51_18]
MFAVPPSSAIRDFQTLYERHYGVVLPQKEAETKLCALLGLLAAARRRAPHGAPQRGECPSGHDEYYRDQLSP